MATSTSLPAPKAIQVDTRGAVILGEESPEVRLSLRCPLSRLALIISVLRRGPLSLYFYSAI